MVCQPRHHRVQYRKNIDFVYISMVGLVGSFSNRLTAALWICFGARFAYKRLIVFEIVIVHDVFLHFHGFGAFPLNQSRLAWPWTNCFLQHDEVKHIFMFCQLLSKQLCEYRSCWYQGKRTLSTPNYIACDAPKRCIFFWGFWRHHQQV